ncbi:MAG: bifunctional YncE family protein/alkaline phosphatase family protein, partial [Vulcanimicrobiaceae bacterium]
ANIAVDGSVAAAGTIALPKPRAPRFPRVSGAYVSAVAASDDERTLYVSDRNSDALDVVDVASQRVVATLPVGFEPAGISVAHANLYVADEGLASYRALGVPVALPAFAPPGFVVGHSSSLAILPENDPQSFDAAQVLALDPMPQGTSIGGAHPMAIVRSHDGRYAFVAFANIDRVAVVDSRPAPHVIGGIDLRFYPGSPYGTQPVALTLGPHGKRLYVALRGLNAIAVLDASKPSNLQHLGLIPTGAAPTALAISKDGKFLSVVDSDGYGIGWSTLERIALHEFAPEHVTLLKATYSALRYARDESRPAPNPLLPQLGTGVRSQAITHVICIAAGQATYDAIFGSAAHRTFAENLTPVLHSLALRYASSRNFYEESSSGRVDRAMLLGGIATPYLADSSLIDLPGAALSGTDDPGDYPRQGYLFDTASQASLLVRNYGGLLDLTGFTNAGQYSMDIPALASLRDRTDLAYSVGNHPNDMVLAKEFVRDYGALANTAAAPDFAFVNLPDESTNTADSLSMSHLDSALGTIVDAVEKLPTWGSTVILVVPGGTGRLGDSVHPQRGFLLAVSPLTKPGYVSDVHVSLASVVKTEEEILGLPALSLNDLLASDLSDLFTPLQSTAAPTRTKRTQ